MKGRHIRRLLPALVWARHYTRRNLVADLFAGVIVTIMLVPQSLAYAMLAGLPPEVGLYSCILPLAAYALFGSSRTLSVGPVAVISLMTASAIAGLGIRDPSQMLAAAVVLALLSGLFLILLGLLRCGFIANFLSHPVVSGFITASGILIALSQFKHILGVSAEGDNVSELLLSLGGHLAETNVLTLGLGLSCLVLLYLGRSPLVKALSALGLKRGIAMLVSKTAPMVVVLLSIVCTWSFDLGARNLALVGTIPAGLPSLTLPSFDLVQWRQLSMAAVLISILGYVESISVGKTLAAKRRQKIDPDQELIGLGVANVASAFSGGFPVAGGFSRSVVNFDAGAKTQAASLFTAIGIAIATLSLTGMLSLLPKAALAAIIIVAVLSLVDFSVLKSTWCYSKSDFAAVSLTMLLTLSWGVEMGVVCGVLTSIVLHLMKTSKPHIAVVGQVAGTEHFRNVKRHQVITHPAILSLRIDESLYFVNAAFLEDNIMKKLAENSQVRHVILMCSAVNEVDISALEVLENLNQQLQENDVLLHLSEVKGPVMDMLRRSHLLDELSGRIFLSQHQAVSELRQDECRDAGVVPGFHDYQI